jgi:hypothetical protein
VAESKTPITCHWPDHTSAQVFDVTADLIEITSHHRGDEELTGVRQFLMSGRFLPEEQNWSFRPQISSDVRRSSG